MNNLAEFQNDTHIQNENHPQEGFEFLTIEDKKQSQSKRDFVDLSNKYQESYFQIENLSKEISRLREIQLKIETNLNELIVFKGEALIQIKNYTDEIKILQNTKEKLELDLLNEKMTSKKKYLRFERIIKSLSTKNLKLEENIPEIDFTEEDFIRHQRDVEWLDTEPSQIEIESSKFRDFAAKNIRKLMEENFTLRELNCNLELELTCEKEFSEARILSLSKEIGLLKINKMEQEQKDKNNIPDLNSLNESAINKNEKISPEPLDSSLMISKFIDEIESLKNIRLILETKLKNEQQLNINFNILTKQLDLVKEEKQKIEDELKNERNNIVNLNEEIDKLKESKSQFEKMLDSLKEKSQKDLLILIQSLAVYIESYNRTRKNENSTIEKAQIKYKNLKKDYEEINQQLKYEKDLRRNFEKKTQELKEKHRNALIKIDFLENKLITIFELNNNITLLEKEFYSNSNFTTKLQEQHKEQIDQLKEELSKDFLEINDNFKNLAYSFTSSE